MPLRIITKYVWNDILGIRNWEKGSFFTVKELLFNPGNTLRDYLYGNRNRYLNPVRFLVFITATVTLATINLDSFGRWFDEISGNSSSDAVAHQVQRSLIRTFISTIIFHLGVDSSIGGSGYGFFK